MVLSVSRLTLLSLYGLIICTSSCSSGSEVYEEIASRSIILLDTEDHRFEIDIPDFFAFRDTVWSWCGNDPLILVYGYSTDRFDEKLMIMLSSTSVESVDWSINSDARQHELDMIAARIGHGRVRQIEEIVRSSPEGSAGWGYETDFSERIEGCFARYSKSYYHMASGLMISYEYQRFGETYDHERLRSIAYVIEKSLPAN